MVDQRGRCVGIDSYKFPLLSLYSNLQSLYTKQMHESIFSGISSCHYAIFLRQNDKKYINSKSVSKTENQDFGFKTSVTYAFYFATSITWPFYVTSSLTVQFYVASSLILPFYATRCSILPIYVACMSCSRGEGVQEGVTVWGERGSKSM